MRLTDESSVLNLFPTETLTIYFGFILLCNRIVATATLQKPPVTLIPIFQTRVYRDELESTPLLTNPWL